MSLSCSYMPDYFSVADILATEERLTCRAENLIPKLGYIDPASESVDIKPGTKLELPFWLAYDLNVLHGQVVSVDIPKIYKEGYRDILEADACAVTLSKWNPHYYELGMHLRKLNNRESEKITDSLLHTFKARFKLVMDWALNPISDATLSSQLPSLEKNLFLAGRKSKILLNQWLHRGTGTIKASEAATNLKKRKRSTYELNY